MIQRHIILKIIQKEVGNLNQLMFENHREITLWNIFVCFQLWTILLSICRYKPWLGQLFLVGFQMPQFSKFNCDVFYQGFNSITILAATSIFSDCFTLTICYFSKTILPFYLMFFYMFSQIFLYQLITYSIVSSYNLQLICKLILLKLIKINKNKQESNKKRRITIMPPKKQQKKQVIPIFEPTPYWRYAKHSQQVLDKTDAFLNNFQNQLKVLIDNEKSFNYNYGILAQKIGTDVHPSLVQKQKQQSQFPNLKSTDYGEKYIVISNHKIDAITIKLLTFLTTHYKINTIKLSNNDLSNQINQIKLFLSKQQSLVSLYFEWNSLKQIPNRLEFFQGLYLNSLQHLILRQCEMGNEVVTALLNKVISNQANNLISLDLYGNQLTCEISQTIVKFIQESKKIEFVGLSKNSFNEYKFLKSLFNSIGEIPLSQEQYQAYKVKQKQRDQINERNKKRKKGAPQQPVPFLFQIKQNEKGRFFVKNLTLKVLNISSNGIKDLVNKQSNVQLIKNFVQNQGKHVELFVQGNSFSKKTKQMFKFYQNINF